MRRLQDGIEVRVDSVWFAWCGIVRGGRGAGRIRSTAATGLLLASLVGVAGTSQAAAACLNEAARTGPSAALPDCRAYELVTPANKSSAVQDMDPSSVNAVPARDGNRVALETLVAFGPRPMPNGSFSVFSRTSSGWQIESVPPPGAGSAFYQEDPIFSPDLTEVGVSSYTTTPLSPEETYQIGPPGGPYDATIATTPTNYERELRGKADDFLAGATPDFSHVFFESTNHTLLGFPTGTVEGAHDLYEWAGDAECGSEASHCELVNVTSPGSFESTCGALFDAVSNNGSDVVFSNPDAEARPVDSACEAPTQLYIRVNRSSTVDISKPNTGVVGLTGDHPVTFEGASADGSKVFFRTETELTQDAVGTHREPGVDEDLYEYDTNAPEGEKLTRISRGTTGAAEGRVEGEYTVTSEDGSEVYFYAIGKLTPEAPELTSATETFNIYGYDTESNEIHYIGTARKPQFPPSIVGADHPRQSNPRTEQVTPNGRFFLFVTRHLFGSSDNPEEFDEVYRYDNETASLACVSCPGSNAPARGGAILGGLRLPTWDGTPSENTVSEDGSYVFFQSNDELVPQDVNGIGGSPGSTEELSPWTDVYEWHEGVISLISSGTEAQPAILVGASADGSNAFFMTHSQLVPQDTDSSADIYDARIDGGFPGAAESSACLGDTCLGTPAALNDPTPAWSSFSGPVNPVSFAGTSELKVKPCGKDKVRSKGKCVKRHKAKKRAAHRAVKHDRGGSR
jgi:hypothetical protein